MKNKILTTVLISIILLLAMVEAVWLFAVPRFADSYLKEHKIETLIKDKTGLVLSFEAAKIETKLDFSLKTNFRGMLLKDSDGNKIMSAGEYELSIRLLPLITKKISLKNIKYNDVFFEASRGKDGKIYLGNLPVEEKNDFKLNDFTINNLNAKNLNITFNDKLLNKNIKVFVKNVELSYDKDNYIDFDVKADFFINDKHRSDINLDYYSKLPSKNILGTDFRCSGKITDFDLSDYSSYIAHFTKKDITSVSGIINAESNSNGSLNLDVSLRNFAVNMKNPLDSIKADSEIRILADADIDSRKINIKNSEIKGANWKIVIKGVVKDYKSKNPKLALNLIIPSSDIHSLYHIAPSFDGDPNEAIQKFKKYGAWGKAEGALQIKGSSENPEVYGDVNISEVYIVKNNPLVPRCKVSVKFIKDKVKVVTKVFASKDEYVYVDGIAEMKVNGAGDFHITSSENVDLATILYMLIPIHDVVGFDLGPLPFMTLKGQGNIDIYTRGSVVEGEIEGWFNFKNTTATLNGLNTVLTGTNGRLDFIKKKLHFYTKSANIKKQPIKVDGWADLDGKIDFDVTSPSIDVSDLFEILNTSPMLENKKTMVESVEMISGKVKTAIKIKGLVKDFEAILNSSEIKVSGEILLKNSKAKLKLFPVSTQNLSGKINFDENDWITNLTGFLGTSKFTVTGGAKNNRVHLASSANALKTDELIQIISSVEKGTYPKLPKTNSLITFNADYKSSNAAFEPEKLNASGYFKPIASQNNLPFVISSGTFKLKNGDLVLDNFNAKIFDSKIFVDGKIKKVFSKNPSADYDVSVSNFYVENFNELKKMVFLPTYVKKILNAYENYKGVANVSLNCRNNHPRGFIELKDISFNHAYFKTPISVESGNIQIDGQKLLLKSVIAKVDNNPLYINASVSDLDKELSFSGYITTKLTDSFANKYINSNLKYPVKPKGDISVTADVKGNLKDYRVNTKIKFAEDADIYYMGADLGDEDNIREISANIDVVGNTYYVHKVNYVRYMTSQNDKTYPLTVFSGSGILQKINDKKFFVRNFNLETQSSANVKMFNVIFKKSVLKNGMFNCKLNIKGDMDNPKILGHVYMDNLDMPLYDTLIKNIALKFTSKNIDIKASGVTYNSDFTLSAVVKNNFKPPFVVENLNIDSRKINLDTFIDSLTRIPTPGMAVKIDSGNKNALNVSDFIIKKGLMTADDIVVRDLPAQNYKADIKLGEDMVLNLDNMGFDVAAGNVSGNAKYDFSSGKIRADLSADDVDSNKIASSWFDFKDQIYGKADGRFFMTTYGTSENERIKNLSGSVYFEITDGKMPKLGSVEYLLKAGNFIKSGVTGASVNNLIDLIAPMKTGYFESIKGKMALKNGVAQGVEVFSKGDNLNIYINGDYDVLQQYANLRVYGRLTRRASSLLGPVGNLSFNTLLNVIPGIKLAKEEKMRVIKDLNKIPGVELSDQQYRVFTAKIDGKINEEKYVKTFRWIE